MCLCNANFVEFGFAHSVFVRESDITPELSRVTLQDIKFATNAMINF